MYIAQFLLIAFSACNGNSGVPSLPVYRNTQAPLESRVNDLFSQLTADEKMDVLTGTAFTTRPISRLGIPAMAMADAGQGVRGGMRSTEGPATAFPSGVAMAATWNTELLGRIGKAIGEEAQNKGTGVQVLLGPAINIQRSPLGGRNGEYFSEDPYLAGRLGVGYILGMQSTGCAACAKHYAANNEEVDRDFVNVNVNERALREIYLPAFEAAVKDGHVWSIMSSYNKVRGSHSSANEYLLTEVLKKGWGFDGLVMSDWGGVHETKGAVNAGNDLEMPGPGFLKQENIARALKGGQITQSSIDDSVRRLLRMVIRVGLLDSPKVPDHSMVNSTEHQKLALEAASDGIVLLKNQGNILPLDRDSIKSIAVIGPGAKDFQIGAAGSPSVQPFYSISPLAGIQRAVKPGTSVSYAPGSDPGQLVPSEVLSTEAKSPGFYAEYFNNQELNGTPAFTRVDPVIDFNWAKPPVSGVPQTHFSVRWTSKLAAPTTGRYTLMLRADDGCRLFLDGKALINRWIESAETSATAQVDLVAGHNYDLRVEYFQAEGDAACHFSWMVPGLPQFAEAVNAARQADVAVVCVSTQLQSGSPQEGEGQDRPSMALPGNQDDLIRAVSAVNKHTIVVLNNGTPVDMRGWVHRVPGIIETWFPGQEGGSALAAILFGNVNPSGKLPTTFGVRREDYPDFGNFPGVKGKVNYAEGIYVGYRHFDKKKIAPLFPFGFGLSYTTFSYRNLTVSPPLVNGSRQVSVVIKNTGRISGAEVAELYVHDADPKIDKPLRELRGFSKVFLAPGESKVVRFSLAPRAFAYCDVPGKQWKADAGIYDIEIGASSRDIRQTAHVSVNKDWWEQIPFLDSRADAVAR